MLRQTIFLGVLLLTMCHITLFEQCYLSANWHMKSKVNRPFIVHGQKTSQRGVYTVKRGTQTLQHAPPVTSSTPMFHFYNMNSLLTCRNCSAKTHSVSHCPLLQCEGCREFGHVLSGCKKTFPHK